jgi:hypothetical protein
MDRLHDFLSSVIVTFQTSFCDVLGAFKRAIELSKEAVIRSGFLGDSRGAGEN